MKRIIVAVTGASGSIYGIRAVEVLKRLGVEVHLIVSSGAELTMEQEHPAGNPQFKDLADVVYDEKDVGSAIASGSFHTDGMIIAPCSIKTLSAVANCYCDNLVSRAADVCLKEGRPLLLAVRETPLHHNHIRLMDYASSAGAIIFPPVPSFYGHSDTIDDMVTSSVGRMVQRIGIDNRYFTEWKGC